MPFQSLGSNGASFESCGDRFRIKVELNPDETTIVSWKTLVKQAAKQNPSLSIPSGSVDPGPVHQQPAIPGKQTGTGSSREGDVVLGDVSEELDDYFQVHNSEIKHDGFFANRGKLERIEPTRTISRNPLLPRMLKNPHNQPKKKKHKDITKGQGGSAVRRLPVKHLKPDNKGKKAASMDRSVGTQLRKEGVPLIILD